MLLALKAHSVAPALDAIAPLLGAETAVVTAQNGVPWWYFYRSGGPLEGTRLEAVDPGGRHLAAASGRSAPSAASSIRRPRSRRPASSAMSTATASRSASPRARGASESYALAEALVAAGLKAPVRTDIRSEIWVKLWGNLSFNPISALTGGTLAEIVADPGTRGVARAMMVEAQAIGEKLGVRFPIDVDRRIDGAGAVGAHKTSMLQDLERGRPMEIDALVTAVQELGRLTETATPTIDIVLGLVRQRARLLGCYD